MNANELADALQETEPYYSTDYKLFDKAAAMLRQQQAEIEALKAHPVKKLSGVEIIGMSGKYDFTYEVDIIDFVRACLKKAQNK